MKTINSTAVSTSEMPKLSKWIESASKKDMASILRKIDDDHLHLAYEQMQFEQYFKSKTPPKNENEPTSVQLETSIEKSEEKGKKSYSDLCEDEELLSIDWSALATRGLKNHGCSDDYIASILESEEE
jgi:hypothetical protein